MTSWICYRSSYDIIFFKVPSSRSHSVKVLSTTVGYFLVAMVTDLCCHITYDAREIICEMLTDIRTMKKCVIFLKPKNHS